MLSVKNSVAGFKAKDIIYQLNSKKVRDIIDLRFHTAEHNKVAVKRINKKISISADIKDIKALVFERNMPDVKACQNSCVFCFLKQLPKNLRKSLYFNDDDWRLSFLCGNYVTLTNFTFEELKRIKRQRISPLYVSVHATNKKIRKRLGLKKPDHALEALRDLDNEGIVTHLQIVLCPGINDGEALLDSLSELQNLKYVKSVGIVPVGLTRYHQNGLRATSASDSKRLIASIGSLQNKYRVSRGSNWLYLADEFYLMASMPIPLADYYDDFDQLENGIGLVRSWLNNFNDAFDGDILGFAKGVPVKGHCNLKSEEVLLLTGALFGPVLKGTLGSLNLPIKVQIISNDFFGPKITVAGLLTAQDIMEQVRPTKAPILIPDVMVNEDKLFLDDVSFFELKKNLPSAILVPSSGRGFSKWLSANLPRITHYLPASLTGNQRRQAGGLRTTGVS